MKDCVKPQKILVLGLLLLNSFVSFASSDCDHQLVRLFDYTLAPKIEDASHLTPLAKPYWKVQLDRFLATTQEIAAKPLGFAFTHAPEGSARKTHDALFETFFPRLNEKSPAYAEAAQINRASDEIRKAMWEEIKKNPSARQGLFLLNHPKWMPLFMDKALQEAGALPAKAAVNNAKKQLNAFLAKTGQKKGFVDFTPNERLEFLSLLEQSPIITLRKMAFSFRGLYLVRTYNDERLLNLLPGYRNTTPTVVPNIEAYLERHLPQLPPPRIQYSAEMKRVEALKDGKPAPFDYVILGSGPAGSVLAHELRTQGKAVLLIEKGSLAVPGALNTSLISQFREANGLRTTTDGSMIVRNGEGGGGGANINIDLSFSPTLPEISKRIEAMKQEGLLPGDFWEPKKVAEAYEWVKKAIGTRTPSLSEVNRNNQILWDGAKNHGLSPDLYDLNNFPPGESPSPLTLKKNPVDHLIFPALQDQKNPLQILPDANVERISIAKASRSEGDMHATGVELTIEEPLDMPGVMKDPHRLGIRPGTKVFVPAKNVIVAAGALGSAKLLLNSNIRNPNLARAFVGHPSMPLIGRFPGKKIEIEKGTPATVYVGDYALTQGLLYESMDAKRAYAAMMMRPKKPEAIFDAIYREDEYGGFGVMLIDTPSNQNFIKLNKRGDPEIHYHLSEADKTRFRFGVAEGIRMLFKAGAKEVILPSVESGVRQVLTHPEQADAIAKNLNFESLQTTVTSAHMQGTTRVGTDARTGVVDARHKVFGTTNIFVSGSAVNRGSIGANPMQAAYTDGKLLADELNQSSR